MGNDGNEKNYVGLAGELRVMSELLLRGYNPMKSYLDSGPDLILSNGCRIEVKTSHIRDSRIRKNGRNTSPFYSFHFSSGKKHSQDFSKIDFAICWGIENDVFYIIPSDIMTSQTVVVSADTDTDNSKYYKCKNNWQLLERF